MMVVVEDVVVMVGDEEGIKSIGGSFGSDGEREYERGRGGGKVLCVCVMVGEGIRQGVQA